MFLTSDIESISSSFLIVLFLFIGVSQNDNGVVFGRSGSEFFSLMVLLQYPSQIPSLINLLQEVGWNFLIRFISRMV
ncbi:hypothetical protein ES708_11672 [subsurface metagenome]